MERGNEIDPSIPSHVKRITQQDVDRLRSDAPLSGSFQGYAKLATNPGVPTVNVWYLASEVGTYSLFLGQTEGSYMTLGANDGIVTFAYNPNIGYWVKEKAAIELINYASKTALNNLEASTQAAVSSRIASSEKAQPMGVATLDNYGKIPPEQWQANPQKFKGAWNAFDNFPELANGIGTGGDTFKVSVAGTCDFGAGNIVFFVNDLVTINDALVWERIPADNQTDYTLTDDSFDI